MKKIYQKIAKNIKKIRFKDVLNNIILKKEGNSKGWNIWDISIVSVCIYTATILAQYGYNNYFNIPSSFIEYSIKDNIIYFFQLFIIIYNIVSVMKWWILLILVIFICSIYILWHRNLIIIGIMLLLLWSSYNLGNWLAVNSPFYYTLPSRCINYSDGLYIIPTFYNESAILIPIEKNTKKMKGGFYIRKISTLDCLIERKEIGKIIK